MLFLSAVQKIACSRVHPCSSLSQHLYAWDTCHRKIKALCTNLPLKNLAKNMITSFDFHIFLKDWNLQFLNTLLKQLISAFKD